MIVPEKDKMIVLKMLILIKLKLRKEKVDDAQLSQLSSRKLFFFSLQNVGAQNFYRIKKMFFLPN